MALKKDSTRINFCTTMNKKVRERLIEYANKEELPISRAIDIAVKYFLDNLDSKDN